MLDEELGLEPGGAAASLQAGVPSAGTAGAGVGPAAGGRGSRGGADTTAGRGDRGSPSSCVPRCPRGPLVGRDGQLALLLIAYIHAGGGALPASR